MAGPENSEGLYRRVGFVEQELASVKTDVNYLRNDIGQLKSSIDGLSTQISQREKTPWAVIFGAASVLLGVVVYHNGLTMEPVKEALAVGYAQVNALKDEVDDRAWKISQSLVRIESLEKKMEYLDINLQREMRDLIATAQVASDKGDEKLDKMLQIEMRLLQEATKQRIVATDRLAAEAAEELDEHRKALAALTAEVARNSYAVGHIQAAQRGQVDRPIKLVP